MIHLHKVTLLSSSFGPIDLTLTGINTPDQNGPVSNGSEKAPHIPQSSRTGAPLSHVVFITPMTLVGGSYPFAQTKSAYSTDQGKWAVEIMLGLIFTSPD